MKRNNAYTLVEGLLGLLIVSICIAILHTCICLYSYQKDQEGYEKIDKEWFYTP